MLHNFLLWFCLLALLISGTGVMVLSPHLRKHAAFKAGWFFVVLIRLLAIPVLGLIALLLLIGAGFPASLAHHGVAVYGLFWAAVLLGGYSWAFYYCCPFFTKHPRHRRWIFAGLQTLPTAAIAWSGLMVIPSLFPFNDYSLARFVSPKNPANEVRFYESGWLDDVVLFCVKPPGQPARQVTDFILDDSTPAQFEYGQWTGDGAVFVCWFTLNKPPTDVPAETKVQPNRKRRTQPVLPTPYPLLAYDFSTGRATQSFWLEYDDANVKYPDYLPIVQKLIDAHGGLEGPRIDHAAIQKIEKIPWFWELPPTKQVQEG